jgi:hypothetical protein
MYYQDNENWVDVMGRTGITDGKDKKPTQYFSKEM